MHYTDKLASSHERHLESNGQAVKLLANLQQQDGRGSSRGTAQFEAVCETIKLKLSSAPGPGRWLRHAVAERDASFT